MIKHIFNKYIILSHVYLFMIMVITGSAAEEPITFRDLIDNWDKYANQDNSDFVYRISSTPRQLLCRDVLLRFGKIENAGVADSPYFSSLLTVGQNRYCIETTITVSESQARIAMLSYIASDSSQLAFAKQIRDTANIWQGFQRQPGISRYFIRAKHANHMIGNFSFDKRYGGFEGHNTCEINFIRGNTIISIFVPYKQDLSHISGNNESSSSIKQPDLSWLSDVELSNSPDPREIAWKIDQYLKGDPLEKLAGEEKQKLQTLKITLPKDTEFEQGKEYPLDFPRKLPDGTSPAEIRLIVSRGEIQQVIEKPENCSDPTVFPYPTSLSPEIDGKYTILFGKPDKQTIRCYHINEEGKCLAWGEIEVIVKQSETKAKTE